MNNPKRATQRCEVTRGREERAASTGKVEGDDEDDEKKG